MRDDPASPRVRISPDGIRNPPPWGREFASTRMGRGEALAEASLTGRMTMSKAVWVGVGCGEGIVVCGGGLGRGRGGGLGAVAGEGVCVLRGWLECFVRWVRSTAAR